MTTKGLDLIYKLNGDIEDGINVFELRQSEHILNRRCHRASRSLSLKTKGLSGCSPRESVWKVSETTGHLDWAQITLLPQVFLMKIFLKKLRAAKFVYRTPTDCLLNFLNAKW